MTAILFGMVLPWILIVGGGWLGFQLVRQNGRILLRLDAIEKQLGMRPTERRRELAGLPPGRTAPDFELPDLTGGHRKLSDFRGREVLLIFFNPACGFCSKMTEELAALPMDRPGEPLVLILISTGDETENREYFERRRIRSLVLLQKDQEVSAKFQAQGTPMGYRIDARGRIASPLAVGAESLLRLLDADSSRSGKAGGQKKEAKSHETPSNFSLSHSRLNRDGLKAGTPAPDFRLPRLDGEELSLADFRGQCVLLVFSDPNCGPCDELAPHLEEIHQNRSDLKILMISRRDTEATRRKAARFGLSFPIVMQNKWEVSLQYAKFATPIGYLIDEKGIIVSDVAVGVAPILALAADGPSRASEATETKLLTEIKS
jgi:peroxiredoxin